MLKRDLKSFLHSLAASSVFLILLVSICFGAAAAMIGGKSLSDDVLKVAIVDNEDSVISRILINTVSDMEYIRTILEVEKTDEESALLVVESGECAAAIILPENFVSDVVYGREACGQVYLSSAVSAQSDAIASAVNVGEKLLAAGQFGVFAGDRLIRAAGADDNLRNSYITKANTGLIAEIMSGSDRYFDVEYLSYANSRLTIAQYFFVCWLCALLFLISLFFIKFFTKDCTRGMLSRLASNKIGTVRFMLWKIVLLTVFRYVIILAAVLPLREILGITPNFVTPMVAAFYITVVGACLNLCTGDGITSNTVVTLVGLLLCGGLVPMDVLPLPVRYIGRLTPLGAAKSMLEPMLGAGYDPMPLCFAAVYTVLAVVLIRSRLNGIISGKCDV